MHTCAKSGLNPAFYVPMQIQTFNALGMSNYKK